jgi:CheY-like chemotaxis protein
MDGEMPELNGYQTTIKIRKGKSFKKFKNFKTIPIIGLMGNNDEKTIKECYNSGMNNHVSKTKSTKEILDTIANFFTKN